MSFLNPVAWRHALTRPLRRGIKKPDEVPKYTVPAIHHIPTNTYMMDSMPILEFLIDKYPSPSITFSTDYTEEVRKHSLTTVGPIYRLSITSRELEILNPASQDYFRAGVEKAFNKPYEQLKEPEKEQAWWEGQQSDLAKVDQMVRANGGPFIMGKEPTASDFFMASSLRTMHEIYEPALDNLFKFKGFKELYEACQPWMERNN